MYWRHGENDETAKYNIVFSTNRKGVAILSNYCSFGIIYPCSITSTISKTITLRLSTTLSVIISPRPITISITIILIRLS